MNLVAGYIKINGIKVDKFKDGKPGDKWFKSFIKRNNLFDILIMGSSQEKSNFY